MNNDLNEEVYMPQFERLTVKERLKSVDYLNHYMGLNKPLSNGTQIDSSLVEF